MRISMLPWLTFVGTSWLFLYCLAAQKWYHLNHGRWERRRCNLEGFGMREVRFEAEVISVRGFLQQMSLLIDCGGVYFGNKDLNIKCLGPWHFSIICLILAASLYLQNSVPDLPSCDKQLEWTFHPGVFFVSESLHGSLAAELTKTAAGYEHLPSLVLILLSLWVLICISTLLAITLRPKAMELMGFVSSVCMCVLRS